jgi:3-methyladenine DNA glycosylase AlkD
MDLAQVLGQLAAKGTVQNRKVYRRHGVRSEVFGVSYGELGKLRRRVGVSHELACALWQTGNHDARVLATMVADPQRMTAKILDQWAKDLDNHVVTGAFAGLVARTPQARGRMEKWTKSRDEWLGSAGWCVLSMMSDALEELGTGELERYLGTIEARIHQSKNRVRYNMNNALIHIGASSAGLKRKALAAARRIGSIEVDHGDTGCKTPDATSYIEKTYNHRRGSKRRYRS